MKKILMVLVLAVLLLPILDLLGLPAGQGKLNDKNGVPVSGSVTMTFAIYDAAK
ncbi:MAG: hypothetical protein HZA15_01440 [Nitrospirae bacterium]|nr:hypothetical protein [Nitrospirota bacterium]